jgi:hypothetical protein
MQGTKTDCPKTGQKLVLCWFNVNKGVGGWGVSPFAQDFQIFQFFAATQAERVLHCETHPGIQF